jgi:hypothetical protein
MVQAGLVAPLPHFVAEALQRERFPLIVHQEGFLAVRNGIEGDLQVGKDWKRQGHRIDAGVFGLGEDQFVADDVPQAELINVADSLAAEIEQRQARCAFVPGGWRFTYCATSACVQVWWPSLAVVNRSTSRVGFDFICFAPIAHLNRRRRVLTRWFAASGASSLRSRRTVT